MVIRVDKDPRDLGCPPLMALNRTVSRRARITRDKGQDGVPGQLVVPNQVVGLSLGKKRGDHRPLIFLKVFNSDGTADVGDELDRPARLYAMTEIKDRAATWPLNQCQRQIRVIHAMGHEDFDGSGHVEHNQEDEYSSKAPDFPPFLLAQAASWVLFINLCFFVNTARQFGDGLVVFIGKGLVELLFHTRHCDDRAENATRVEQLF